jgi:hypothetical protein
MVMGGLWYGDACTFIDLNVTLYYLLIKLFIEVFVQFLLKCIGKRKSEAIVRAGGGERGAGSGDFESGEQELTSEF